MPRRSRREVEETDAEEEEERRQRRRTSEEGEDEDEDEDEDEEEDDEEEDEDEEDEEEGGGYKRRRRGTSASQFIDDQAIVASDDEEEDDDEIEDGFIVHEDEQEEEEGGDSSGRRTFPRRPFPLLPPEDDDEEEDIEAMEKRIMEKYGGEVDDEVEDYDDDDDHDHDHDETRQQALLPSIRDPKLWMVKCIAGHEREVSISLLQRHMNRGSETPLIKSAIALDHLKSYVYIEADKEAHVKAACRGLRYIMHSAKPMLVPIKEMTDVVSVRSKAAESVNLLAPDTWVRMKIASYKGDLARVVEVDDVKKKVTVKLVPRVDLQAIADKFEGLEVTKKKIVPQRLMNIDEARDLGLPTACKRDRISGEAFESVGGMKFRDGFLFKTVSMKSVSTENIQPTLDEFEKFWMPENAKNLDEAVSMEDSAGSIFGNRKKSKFIQGNAVIVVSGDLVNIMGSVERVDGDIVNITPKMKDFPDTAIPIHEKYLSKYFKPGDHVKVVSGEREGESGMVVTVQGRVLRIVSDATKEEIQVFADNVVGSSDVTCGVLRVGDYELHDLVLLDNGFGVILRVESGAFQVLKGNTEKAEVVAVRLREIKTKLDRKTSAQDRQGNVISAKSIVTILEGPCKGKQGSVEHIYRGVLFIRDRHHLEHSGFICVKARSCTVLGGTCSKEHKNNNYLVRNQTVRTAPHRPTNNSRPPTDFRGRHMAGSRGRDSLIGTSVRICAGAFKGYRGIVKEAHGKSVRVELESQMKVIAVDRDHISDKPTVSSQCGSRTPVHAATTPLRPCMTPQRDPRATPIHDGMRTPMRDRAWNPYYAPVTPARENWDNDGSWRTSPGNQPGTPLYQPGTPPVRLRESSPGFRSTPTHQSPQLSPRTLTVGSQ